MKEPDAAPPNVIDLGAFRVKVDRYRPSPPKRCEHNSVVIDEQGGVVECDECKKTVSAFVILVGICRRWVDIAAEVHRQKLRAWHMRKMLAGYKVRLRALKSLEKSWWRGGMVPCCPHCRRGLLAEDFADRAQSMMSQKYELKRRERERQK